MSTELSNEVGCDENALILAVQNGEVEKYRLVIRLHVTRLQGYVAYRVWDRRAATELVHETFVWAFQNLSGFQPGTSMQAWLRVIAWNLIRAEAQRFARDTKNRDSYAVQEAWNAALDAGGHRYDSPSIETLLDCLKRLPEGSNEAKLIQLRYHGGLSSAEIAERMERNSVWVRVNLHRVINQLRACVERKEATVR